MNLIEKMNASKEKETVQYTIVELFEMLKEKVAEINQHQLEVHALGEANLNQAMMLAKKQEEIDDLKAQLNNMEACYIQVKKELEDQHKKVDEVLEYLDGESANRWGLWKEKADMFDQGASNAFEEAYWVAKKALRGEHE